MAVVRCKFDGQAQSHDVANGCMPVRGHGQQGRTERCTREITGSPLRDVNRLPTRIMIHIRSPRIFISTVPQRNSSHL